MNQTGYRISMEEVWKTLSNITRIFFELLPWFIVFLLTFWSIFYYPLQIGFRFIHHKNQMILLITCFDIITRINIGFLVTHDILMSLEILENEDFTQTINKDFKFSCQNMLESIIFITLFEGVYLTEPSHTNKFWANKQLVRFSIVFNKLTLILNFSSH